MFYFPLFFHVTWTAYFFMFLINKVYLSSHFSRNSDLGARLLLYRAQTINNFLVDLSFLFLLIELFLIRTDIQFLKFLVCAPFLIFALILIGMNFKPFITYDFSFSNMFIVFLSFIFEAAAIIVAYA